MKSAIKYLLGVILFFLHIYVIKFTFSPISSRILFGFLGAILILINLFKSNRVLISKNTFKYLIMLVVIGFISIVTNSIHATTEFHYITFIFQSIIIICSSYFCVFCISRLSNDEISFDFLAKIFIGAVSLQMIITSVMFLSPSIRENLIGILSEDSHSENFLKGGIWRVTGFGSEYFIAGVVNCFTLLLISHCSLSDKFNKKVLATCFILISIVGTVMSRTTLVGIVLGACYIIIKGNSKIRISILKYVVSLIIILFVIGNSIKFTTSDQLESTMRFGFEMFYNYSETGSFTTASADNLFNDHYSESNIPKGITLFLGDGLYAAPNDSAKYYKNVDAGYLRLVYYFGIIGLIAFLAVQYYLLKTSKIDENTRFGLKWYLMFLLILLNIKGVTDLTPFIAPFIFVKSTNLVDEINSYE